MLPLERQIEAELLIVYVWDLTANMKDGDGTWFVFLLSFYCWDNNWRFEWVKKKKSDFKRGLEGKWGIERWVGFLLEALPRSEKKYAFSFLRK